MKRKLVLLLSAVLCAVTLFSSCGDKELIDVSYADEAYKEQNKAFFPGSTEDYFSGGFDPNYFFHVQAQKLDPSFSEEEHYKHYAYPNFGIEPTFEKHVYFNNPEVFLVSCRPANTRRSNGYYYHQVTYRCSACSQYVDYYVLCKTQDGKCTGTCINMGRDLLKEAGE